MNLMCYYAGNPTWNWKNAEKHFENYWANISNEIAPDSTDGTDASNAAESHSRLGPMCFVFLSYC